MSELRSTSGMTGPTTALRGATAGGTGDQVKVRGVNKTFRRRGEDVHVLRDIDLDVRDGELLVLLGPSGCGKTTLLRCLVGLERPDGGTIELRNRVVVDAADRVFLQPNKRDVGMVFQNYALWPHMTIAKNVAYPLRAKKQRELVQGGRVQQVLDLVQCGHLADRFPPELSGGQQQRVALARALAPNPALLLLDEPLSNLDALLRVELRSQLRILHREVGFTGVYVTHDQEEALALGTRVAVMRAGQIEQIGIPSEVYRLPATEYVADFLGARNKLVLDADAAELAGQAIGPIPNTALRGPYTVRVRPDNLALRSADSNQDRGEGIWLRGARIIEVIPGTEHYEHLVQLGNDRLTIYVPLDGGVYEVGQDVEIGLDPGTAFCYGSNGRVVSDWWDNSDRRAG